MLIILNFFFQIFLVLSIVIVSALGAEEVAIEEKPAEEKPAEETPVAVSDPAPLPAEARFAEDLIGTNNVESDSFEAYEAAPDVATTVGSVEAPAEGQRAHYYYGQARVYAPQVRSYAAQQPRAYYSPQRIAYIG